MLLSIFPMTDAQAHLSYRPDIDGLRGLAVAAVVAFHASRRVAPGGFVGVDVFFVISGFLISGIIFRGLREGTFTFHHFYVRRVLRIFPALLVLLVAVLAAGWFALLENEYRRLGAHTVAGAAFFANVAFWREAGYFDTTAELKPLLHLWSLGVEEQFYFLWPALLVIIWRSRMNVVRSIGVIAAASFVVNVAGIHNHGIGTFFLPFARLWELLLGALLAWVALSRGRLGETSASSSVLSVLGVLMICTAIIVLNRDRAYPGWWALLPTVGTALVIAAGQKAWPNRVVLSHPLIVFVGLISYPLYLWHWPLLSFSRQMSGGGLSARTIVLMVAAAVGLAWLTYRFVERPIRFGPARGLNIRAGLLAAGMVVVAAAGVAVSKGIVRTRLDEKFEFLSNYQYDYPTAYRGIDGQCLISVKQTPADFAASCVDTGFGAAKTSILLLGDSHAAHLYPGLRHFASERKLALAQYTADACLPLIPAGTEFCRSVNAFVLNRVHELSPDVVVLAGTWNEPRLDRIKETIAALRQAGAREIIVVGPVPRWQQPLPNALVREMEKNPLAGMPRRMHDSLAEEPFAIEGRLEKHLEGIDVTYVSALSALCDAGGCLTIADGQPTAWDEGHLTETGSRVVATAIMNAVDPRRWSRR